jgi:ABC-type transport system involved in cytochrome bd biosynthesis fused ATPase/permease subunit
MNMRLLYGPAIIVAGMLCISIGVGMFDFRIGLVVGGSLLVPSGFLVASVISRLEERKNEDSGSIPARRS